MNDDFKNYTRSGPTPRRSKWVTDKEFEYRDADGRALFRVHRQGAYIGRNPVFDDATGKLKKRCFQRWLTTPDGKKPRDAPVVPYRLPELITAVKNGRTIFVVEGEPKVELLRSWGLAATCNAEGAGKWRPQHTEYLRGADVVIMPDNDAPGRAHSDLVGRSLAGVAARCRRLELPELAERGDVVDWAAAGGTREQFEQLAAAAPDWQPHSQTAPAFPDDDGHSEAAWLARLNDEYCVIQDGGKTLVLWFRLDEQIKDGRVVHRRLVAEFFGSGTFAITTKTRGCGRSTIRAAGGRSRSGSGGPGTRSAAAIGHWCFSPTPARRWEKASTSGAAGE
jgi:hypothetical protein